MGRLARPAVLALAVSLVLDAEPAMAERQDGLLEMLFGGPVRHKPRAEARPKAPKPAAKRAIERRAAPKIAGPSYYTYKADPLVSVDLAAIGAAPQGIAFEPSLSGPTAREAVAGLEGFDLRAEKDVAQALVDYYTANPEFLWVSGYSANGKAEEAVRVLGEAGSYGLDPADYSVSVPPASFDMNDMRDRLAALARFEMTLSARVLRYARDAWNGRIDPNRISGYHELPPKPLDLRQTLSNLARTQEVRAYLESRHPQNPEYQALRVELEALRASEENEIVVDPKLLLKPGGTSAELPKLLRIIARDLDDETGGDYGELLYSFAGAETYVPELAPLIKAVQKRAGLQDDGVIGPRTVGALTGVSKADRIARVKLALERLRWLPSDLGSPRVFINEPAYTASFIEGGEEKLKMRVVVGKKTNQTAFFYKDAQQVDYNPYWGVPQSIIVNEMLPRLRGDPGYLDRAGYEVTDAKGRRIPSSSINWGAYGARVPFNVRQTPSEANALGELKILFPNKHAIYMHDTPQKALFQRDARAFSHGCVRLADPRGMAAAVLGTTTDHIAEKLKQGHSSEKVARTVPIYVAYFTAWPTLSGKVEYFTDIYDRDAYLQTAIEKTEAVRSPAS